MTSSAPGRCSGASGVTCRSAASSAASIRCGVAYAGPPCTSRCPIAAAAGTPRCSRSANTRRTAAPCWEDSRVGSARIVPLVSSSSFVSPIRYSANLSEEEPALRHRMSSGIGPRPVAHLGQILEMLADIRPVSRQHGPALVDERRRAPGHARPAPERLDTEVIAADAVPDDHVERRGGRPLLVESTHVETVRPRSPVHDLVDGALVTVEGEHHVRLAREELDEVALLHAVGM